MLTCSATNEPLIETLKLEKLSHDRSQVALLPLAEIAALTEFSINLHSNLFERSEWNKSERDKTGAQKIRGPSLSV